jgi:hypothetical protein
VAAGTHVKLVSDLLGHATIQQTANTYMHGDQAVTAEWMQRFEDALNVEIAPGHLTNPKARASRNLGLLGLRWSN